MITGFTGSSRRMSPAQQAAVVALVIESTELHHGDCVVADEWAHKVAVDLERRVVIHPPDDAKKRAFCARTYPGPNVSELPTEPYLDRNRSIVSASDRLVACPDRAEAEGRAGGGVWATVRYALEANKTVIIIDQHGNVMEPDALVPPKNVMPTTEFDGNAQPEAEPEPEPEPVPEAAKPKRPPRKRSKVVSGGDDDDRQPPSEPEKS